MGAEALALREAPAEVVLDGAVVRVHWVDGDTFHVKSGPRTGEKARLGGYNTLETHGPVHRWGRWTAGELYDNAKAAHTLARSATWTCKTDGKVDAYGRSLVSCDDLAVALIESGLAHVYAFEGTGAPRLVEAQRTAIRKRRGMWRKGVPGAIVTSLHSADERAPRAKPDAGVATQGRTPRLSYDRTCDTRTGVTTRIPHRQTYADCQVVCHGGSCMTYVRFEHRYGRDRAACLRIHGPPAGAGAGAR